MSTARITRPMVERTLFLIDESGVLDILAPPPPPGRPGRKGRIRENTRLWLIGVILCTRLGLETTLRGVHAVLTEALPREMQWELGVLRPLTTKEPTLPRDYDPGQPRLTKNGKPRKEIWVEHGMERLGYDDLVNVVSKLRADLDYGVGSNPKLSEAVRLRRRTRVEDAVDALMSATRSAVGQTRVQ